MKFLKKKKKEIKKLFETSKSMKKLELIVLIAHILIFLLIITGVIKPTYIVMIPFILISIMFTYIYFQVVYIFFNVLFLSSAGIAVLVLINGQFCATTNFNIESIKIFSQMAIFTIAISAINELYKKLFNKKENVERGFIIKLIDKNPADKDTKSFKALIVIYLTIISFVSLFVIKDILYPIVLNLCAFQ